VLEVLARLEVWNEFAILLDSCFAGFRISDYTSLPVVVAEAAKTTYFNAFTGGQGIRDGFKYGIDGQINILDRQLIQFPGYFLDQS
jgi:hypothetical protein